jgi:hypothetical protein
MRELVEIDWLRKRGVLEFYIGQEDTNLEKLQAHILSVCEDVSMKVDTMEIFLLNTGAGSRLLAENVLHELGTSALKVTHKAAVGF